MTEERRGELRVATCASTVLLLGLPPIVSAPAKIRLATGGSGSTGC